MVLFLDRMQSGQTQTDLVSLSTAEITGMLLWAAYEFAPFGDRNKFPSMKKVIRGKSIMNSNNCNNMP